MKIQWNDGRGIDEVARPDGLRAIRRGYAVRVVESQVVEPPEVEPEPEETDADID